MTGMYHRTMHEYAACVRRGRRRQFVTVALVALFVGMALGYWCAR